MTRTFQFFIVPWIVFRLMQNIHALHYGSTYSLMLSHEVQADLIFLDITTLNVHSVNVLKFTPKFFLHNI